MEAGHRASSTQARDVWFLLRGLVCSTPLQCLRSNLFLDSGLDYIYLVYKAVDPQVNYSQPNTGLVLKAFITKLSQVPSQKWQ